MSGIDTDKLRELADAATPGWWFVQMEKDSDEVVAIVSQYAVVQESGKKLSNPRADADFIAAANPVAVRRLLDRIADLERQLHASRLRGQALAEEVMSLHLQMSGDKE